jgi:peptidoglycan/LPS O-acetylase OafA/YrhL
VSDNEKKDFSMSLNFRYDINVLRAFAVISVVLFHFNQQWLPSGFIGVDIFFVISGYLMTAIILGKIKEGNFSISAFYLARARRIIPALAVLCIFLLVMGWFSFYNIEYKTLSKHVYSSLGFFSNITYWQESGYFSAHAHENWLLHTWSLSVEWQFYLIYPLIIVLLVKLSSLRLTKLCITISLLVSFLLSVYASRTWPDAAYFLLPTRAWQMLFGALAFIYPINLNRRLKHCTLMTGFTLIGISLLVINNELAWPSYYALLPVLGVYLIILSSCQNIIFFKSYILNQIGKWSYSIYLWHWPIVVYLNNREHEIDHLPILIGISLSILLGFLSFNLIEKNTRSYSFLLPTGLAVTLSIVIYSLNGISHPIRPISELPANSFIAKYKAMNKEKDGPTKDCNVSKNISSSGVISLSPYCIDPVNSGGIFLWGDSHLAAIAVGLREKLESKTTIHQVTSSGCYPSFTQKLGTASKLRAACDKANELAKASIAKIKPDIVLIAMKDKHEKMDWKNTLQILKDNGVEQIIVLGPVPQWYPSLPIIYAKNGEFKDTLTSNKLDGSILKTNIKLSKLMEGYPDITYISLIDKLCETKRSPIKCTVKFNGELISFDYGHLTKPASISIFEQYVNPALIKINL